MREGSVAVTRGGVTYQIKRPIRPSAAEVVHWLKVGDAYYRIAEPALAENGNAGSTSSRVAVLLARLRDSLNASDSDDLRAGAIVAVLCAGIRKRELLGLDVGDLREVDGVLALCVRRTRLASRSQERVVVLAPENAAWLREYWRREQLALEDCAAPLFRTLGRHGRCRRTRITGHAVDYWLQRLRRLSGIEERLTSRSLVRRGARGALTLAKESPAGMK